MGKTLRTKAFGDIWMKYLGTADVNPTLLIFDIVSQAGNSYSDALHKEIERDGVIIYGEI